MHVSSLVQHAFRYASFIEVSLPIAVLTGFIASAAAQSTTRESVDGRGFEVIPGGSDSQLTPDARFVVFSSNATNLVPGDANSEIDVFRRDRTNGEVVLVSRTFAGQQGSEPCWQASISADGRYVAFATASPEYLGESELDLDVFMRDLTTGTLTWISAGAGGGGVSSLHPAISADGHRVAYASSAGSSNFNVLVRDLLTAQTMLVSIASNGAQANGSSYHSALSADGRFVAFESAATNLVVATLPPASYQQIYVRDLLLGTTELASQAAGGGLQAGYYSAPGISADGRYVTCAGVDIAGIASVFERDRLSGLSQIVAQPPAGFHAYGPVPVSADGRYVAFSSDYDFAAAPSVLGGAYAVFVRDMLSNTYVSAAIKVDGTTIGAQLAAMSADGRYVTFTAAGSNLVIGDTHQTDDVFVRDMTATGLPKISTYCEGKINSAGCTPKISASGRATASGATTLLITATKLINQSNGLLFWGLGAQATPFQGGTMCVTPPRQRTAMQDSGGSAAGAVDCTGRYSFNFDASYIAAHGLSAGMFIHCQYYQRDTGLLSPGNVGLSDAIKFPIQL